MIENDASKEKRQGGLKKNGFFFIIILNYLLGHRHACHEVHCTSGSLTSYTVSGAKEKGTLLKGEKLNTALALKKKKKKKKK